MKRHLTCFSFRDQRGRRPRFLRRRFIVGYLLLAAVLAVAAVSPSALGVFGNAAPSERPTAAATMWQKTLTLKTSSGKELALWRGATPAGGRCVKLNLSDGEAPMQSDANAGGGCELGAPRPQKDPIQVAISWLRIDGKVTALLDGRVAPGRGIEVVALESPESRDALPFRSGYFLGELPEGAATQIGELARAFAVVGYDRAGNEVARKDLQALLEEATPGG